MSKPALKKSAAKGRNMADFRATHDRNVIVPTKLRKALSELEAEGGAENWCYEIELLKRATISTTDMGLFRDQFTAHIVETTGPNPKRIWVATAKAATKFREVMGG